MDSLKDNLVAGIGSETSVTLPLELPGATGSVIHYRCPWLVYRMKSAWLEFQILQIGGVVVRHEKTAQSATHPRK